MRIVLEVDEWYVCVCVCLIQNSDNPFLPVKPVDA